MFNKLFSVDSPGTPFPFYIKGRDDVIFIHIIKSAGTSIAKAIDLYPPRPEQNLLKHWHAREIENVIGVEKWNAAFKFAFVRNPWERLVSFYKFQLRNPVFYLPRHPIPFPEWLQKTIGPKPDFLYEGHLGRLFKPQSYWLKDKTGEIHMDFIGRFETLKTDFDKLCEAIDLPGRTLPHINRSEQKEDMDSWYDAEGRALVSAYYREDIERFEYAYPE